MLKGVCTFSILWFFIMLTSLVKAQPQFEIPGQFVFDVYLSQFNESAPEIPLKTWGSRGFNIYYLQEINIAKDKISLNPGVGISSEKYSFAKEITLEKPSSIEGINIVDLPASWDVRKTFLSAEYLDVPIELRFQTAEGYRAFRFAIGFRVGLLLNSKTKIKYEDLEEEVIILKQQNNFLINRWRYGLIARIGLGKVNGFAAYNITPVFKENALEDAISGYNPRSFAIGITFFTF